MYIINSFSLNMIEGESLQKGAQVNVRPIKKEEIPDSAVSAIGHADTAAIVGSDLGREVPMNRATIALKKGDSVFVAQYVGPRLPEGSKTLPEGSKILYFCVEVAE